ncbi:polyprenol phosphomannose-dependent alpha 1,6 mannosyltransferase MptB [Tamaricihabitans halophyticus]|uniref:polyprenol phosphomannose-dependent alpha 1,6 mannosyltransferase MptB n=1 Tax=Tamaricihabitans halophyticus TaxID=1262583 RepID=UPI001FB24B6C|nr:polyprenol phosphomannose-dependent alpha 1,6 mannosyltransferase MptB [Tamaricihabitans halophyticus]
MVQVPVGATVFRWLGLAGVLLVTLSTLADGADQFGVRTDAVLGWLTEGAAAPLAVAVSGMGLVVLAWLRLARFLAELSAGWLRGTLALWGAPLLVAPPLFSGDVHSYLAQGEVAARGLNPATVSPLDGLGAAHELTGNVSSYWQDTASPYGPVFGTIQRLIAELTDGSVLSGVLAHRVVAVAGLVLIVWAVPKLAARAGVSVPGALWLGVLNPLVLWHFIAGIHNDALMLGLALAGVALALSGIGERIAPLPLCGGVVLIALAVNVKLPAAVGLAVVGVALARHFGATFGRFVLAGLAMCASLALITLAVAFSSGLGFHLFTQLSVSGEVNSWMAPTNWVGFLVGAIGMLFGANITQPAIEVGKLIGMVVAVAGIGKVLVDQLRGRYASVTSLGALLAVVVVFGPVVQPWYILWAAVPLAACLAPGKWRNTVIGVVAVFSVILPPLGGNFADKIGELVLGYAVAIAVLAVATVLSRPRKVAV